MAQIPVLLYAGDPKSVLEVVYEFEDGDTPLLRSCEIKRIDETRFRSPDFIRGIDSCNWLVLIDEEWVQVADDILAQSLSQPILSVISRLSLSIANNYQSLLRRSRAGWMIVYDTFDLMVVFNRVIGNGIQHEIRVFRNKTAKDGYLINTYSDIRPRYWEVMGDDYLSVQNVPPSILVLVPYFGIKPQTHREAM